MPATRREVLLEAGILLGAAATGRAVVAQPAVPGHGHPPAGVAPPAPPAGATSSARPAGATPAAPPARMAAPADAYVYIGWPQDGEVVNSRFKVWFGTRNFGVAPAGVTRAGTGHHHLLVDVPLPAMDQPIPNDRNHLHFGLGQTETMLELPPGRHTLQLLMGDADHVPHDPPVMSRRITITVRPGRPSAPVAAAAP